MAVVNPVTVAAASSVAKGAKEAAPEIKKGAKKINKDTKNSLSWLVVIGAAAAIYTVWKISGVFRSGAGLVSNTIDTAGNIIDSTGTIIGNVFDDLNNSMNPEVPPVRGIPTINETTATNKAALLRDAMEGPGTNFTRIKDALEGMTLADFELISQKFGTPYYIDPNPFSGNGIRKRTLIQWLTIELRTSQINELGQMIPGLF